MPATAWLRRLGRAWLSLVLLLCACDVFKRPSHCFLAAATSADASKPAAAASRRRLEEATVATQASSAAAGGFRSRCPGNCTAYGTCHEELGRCDCPRNRDGPDCSRLLPRGALLKRCREQGYSGVKDCMSREQSCINACNRRGTCVAGFCHCRPGHYGADCSLSLGPDGRPALLAGGGYTTRAKRPWVYVYELPPHLVSWYNFRRLDRPLHLYLWQRLLSAGVRTADGDAADYYFLPVRQRSFSESSLLEEAISYVSQLHPWWNRTGGGRRHMVLQTGDWGRAEQSEELQALSGNMTWLTHWGLSRDRHSEVLRWSASFRPDKDVVLPVYISPGHFVKFGVTRSPLHPALAARARPRTAATLFFAGRICLQSRKPDNASWPGCGDKDDWYSGGIREKVHVHHWNRTGYRVVRSEPRYADFLAGSQFCLAPPGAGHGQRQVQALFMGCVPVSIGDHVAEPFEPALDWQDWGVRVAEADIPRMHRLLAAVTPEQLQAKQSRMHCAAQHMLYSSITGAVLGEDGRYDAFETTLEVLRVMAAHPDAAPQQYRRLDPAFDAFMDCRDPPGWVRPAAEGTQAVAGNASATAADAPREGGDGAVDGGEEQEGEGEDEGEAAESGEANEMDGEHDEDVDGGDEGADGSDVAPSPPGPPASNATSRSVAAGPVLCSHARRDMHRRERSCYYLLRGSGHMGVPGGAVCARGHRYNLAACPRLWG